MKRFELCSTVYWQHRIIPRLPDALYRPFHPFGGPFKGHAFASRALQRRYQQLSPKPWLRLVPDAKAFACSLLCHGHLAERMVTWSSWAAGHGFQYRYPLLDRALIELLLTFPRLVLFGDGRPRFLVRHAFASLLRQSISQRDEANERRRHQDRLHWWRRLQALEAQGAYDALNPWLEMPKLKAVIRQGPCGHRVRDTQQVARLFTALRIWALYQRYVS